MAKVLQEPVLKFQSMEGQLRNGSWNLNRVKFDTVADLSSFAILDMTPGRGINYFRNLLKVCVNHGMTLPENVNPEQMMELVVHTDNRARNPGEIFDAVSTAIEKARYEILLDRSELFQSKKVWFKSRVINKSNGLVEDCLVIPPPQNIDNEVGIILREDVWRHTHEITNVHNGETANARIMGKFVGYDAVDPFNYRWNGQSHEVRSSANSNSWTRAEFLGHVYALDDGKTLVSEAEIERNPMPTMRLETWQVECPCVLLVFLPDNTSERYHIVKMASHFSFGVPCQCAVADTFSRQKNQDQYCSNIALKLNTKLSNSWNKARAWGTYFNTGGGQEGGIPWVKDVPTFVMGIGVSHGLGADSISVIGASVALDEGCMRMAQELKVQTKSDMIADSVMQDIVKALAIQFTTANKGKSPERILVYRDGISEGNLNRSKENELRSIRQAFYDFHRMYYPNFSCDNSHCEGRGCLFCTPPITFIVCQSQHSIRVVPDEEPADRNKNVHSGTCLDHTVMDFRNKLNMTETLPEDPSIELFEVKDEGYDFLLTAQGGLKGTSKPIYYRVLLNENAIWKKGPTPLTKDALQLCTYHQSYQYGTATKAVRSVPVVYYSKRLAEMAMGYINYLRGRKGELPDTVGGVIGNQLEDVSEEEQKYLPRGRDGAPIGRFKFVRQDADPNESLPSEIRTELLPSFSPFERRLEDSNKWRSPFRPHLSA